MPADGFHVASLVMLFAMLAREVTDTAMPLSANGAGSVVCSWNTWG